MKKVLLVVALLLLATPAFAADVTITATVGSATHNPGDGNELIPVTVGYTSSAPGAISAFAIRMTSDSGAALDHIRDYNVGESNGLVPGGKNGYGIFPGKFRNVTVYNGTSAGYLPGSQDANYNPLAPPGDFNSGGYQGSGNLVMELGTLYTTGIVGGDANKPPASGTLFTIDVNSHRGYPGMLAIPDCNVCIVVEQSRGGVVKADATAASVTLPGTAGCIKITYPPCTLPNVVGEAEATATTDITNAGFALGTRTTTCSNTVAAGSVISTNPAAGSYTCGSSVAYVVSTGPCGCIVPNVVGVAEATATASITAAGFTLGTRTTTCSATIASGSVISTNPAYTGTPITCGQAVAYVVSTGPCVCTVPNVVGVFESPIMTAGPNAVGQLIAAGFTTARTTTTSATVAAGKVISTAPAAGATPGCGTVVTMTVSTGKGTCATCKGDLVANSILEASDMSNLKSALLAGYARTGLYKVDKGSAVVGDKWNICGDLVADNALQASDMSNLKSKLLAGFTAGGLYKAPFVPINNPVKTQAAMTTAITNSFLVVGTVTTAHSATVPSGSVISTNPAYPTYRNCNTTVDMVVSVGP